MDKSTLENIIQILEQELADLQSIYLFGSIASGEDVAGSDIDLAFLSENLVPNTQRWNIAQMLAVSLGCDVDLIDLRQATTVMQKEIITTGQRILCKSMNAVEHFETYVFSAYTHLNEERRGILEDIRDRGSVYG